MKQLRQDRQICFQTLDNKYIYPLIELLAHKGIKEYIAYDVRNVQEQIEIELGDAEPAQEIEEKERGVVITNAPEEGIRKEPTEEQVKAHMEQYLPKEEEPQEVDFEEELRREIKYVEPFTYPSKSLPEGQKHNVFRVHNPDRTRDFVESISGVVHDIQWYQAAYNDEDPYPKVRFFLYDMDKTSYILQMRYDKHMMGHIADAIAEFVMVSESNDKITIGLSSTKIGKTILDVWKEDGQTFSMNTGERFIPKIKEEIVKAKLEAAMKNLKEKLYYYRIMNASADKSKV